MKHNHIAFYLWAISLITVFIIIATKATATVQPTQSLAGIVKGNPNPFQPTAIVTAHSNLSPTPFPVSAKPLPNSTPEIPSVDKPDSAEYFQLSLPLASKPYLGGTPVAILSDDPNASSPIRAIVWNAIVDHTTPFYTQTTDQITQPYTGEIAVRPTNGPANTPTVPARGPGAYGVTPNNRNYFYNGHAGLDLNASIGTPVYAAHAGVISHVNTSGDFHGYGFAIVLTDAENPGFLTLYGHLSSSPVLEGDRVARGQLLGLSGNTGAGTGAHLHFGVYQGMYADDAAHVLDPFSWFSYQYDNLRQRTPSPTEFQNIPPYYRWASGYPATSSTSEPQNYNLGSISGNQYIPKNRVRTVTPAPIGLVPTGSTPNVTVHPIERAWANMYGSIGAPYGPAFGSSGSGCQYFEGGTLCETGQGGFNYSARFTDVPYTFWANRYIGWVINEDIAQGYPCGGPDEPCDSGNRPYFRPSNHMTRGQFSKVVSNMFGFTENPGGQIYEDVAPGNTFYDWINRLSNRGIMSGYVCGSVPNTPCVYPLNRPYFLFGNDITRGQGAKILANTATTAHWLYLYYMDDGPDFYDVQPGSTFYSFVEQLYKAGVVQYRLEDASHVGQGGQFYVSQPLTRAEVTMFLHELVYAAAPGP